MSCASSSSKVSSFKKEAFLNKKSSKFKNNIYEIENDDINDKSYDFMGWFSKDDKDEKDD